MTTETVKLDDEPQGHVVSVYEAEVTFGLVRTKEGMNICFFGPNGERQLININDDIAAANKARDRKIAATAVGNFTGAGRSVYQGKPREGNGYNARDWDRKQKGLKVATKEEIESIKDIWALNAVKAKDAAKAMAVLQGTHDRAIKFAIEDGRMNMATGEIAAAVPGSKVEE